MIEFLLQFGGLLLTPVTAIIGYMLGGKAKSRAEVKRIEIENELLITEKWRELYGQLETKVKEMEQRVDELDKALTTEKKRTSELELELFKYKMK